MTRQPLDIWEDPDLTPFLVHRWHVLSFPSGSISVALHFKTQEAAEVFVAAVKKYRKQRGQS